MSKSTKENNLVKKLTQVLAEASKVNKSGYNSHQKYHYITESDLLDAIREKLVELGIFIFSSVEECVTERIEGSRQPVLTNVKMKYTFVDGDSGEQFSVMSCGQGADNGDKGVYKAITGANKYFLLKTFMLSGDDDPENDGVTSKNSGTAKSNSGTTKGMLGGKKATETKTTSSTTFGSSTKNTLNTVKKANTSTNFSKKEENNVTRPSFGTNGGLEGSAAANLDDDEDVGF